MFKNHRKSLIQYCERSELHLHFEWTKVNQKCQKWSILRFFENATICVIFKHCEVCKSFTEEINEHKKPDRLDRLHFYMILHMILESWSVTQFPFSASFRTSSIFIFHVSICDALGIELFLDARLNIHVTSLKDKKSKPQNSLEINVVLIGRY